MLKSNKLTSESGLTTNRPTSRIDSSYLNRGTSQNTQRQSVNKKLWIKINKVNEDHTDTQPYIEIEKQRKTNSCHFRPSLNRNTSSDVKNQIDFDEIKHYIQEIDQNYEDDPFSKQINLKQTQQYQNEKRLSHLNLLFSSFKDRIKSRNISNDIESYIQQKFNNKIKIRSKQFALIKQKSDNLVGFKISNLKQKNRQHQLIYSNCLKSFRASSDYILNQIPQLPYQQISKLTDELGNLENYNLTSERIESQKDSCKRPKTFVKHLLKRNQRFPNEQDNQLFLDESVISETEAKLNLLYSESISIQKNLLQNQKSNPIKIINAIKKMDQIQSSIERVNANKLMNKFII